MLIWRQQSPCLFPPSLLDHFFLTMLKGSINISIIHLQYSIFTQNLLNHLHFFLRCMSGSFPFFAAVIGVHSHPANPHINNLNKYTMLLTKAAAFITS